MQKNLIKVWDITWTHLFAPSHEEIEKLSQLFDFHEIIEEDLLETNIQDKVDTYDDYVFLVLHFPKYRPSLQRYILNEFKIILGNNFIISISSHSSSHIRRLMEQYQKESEQIEDDEEYKISTYYILYLIIDSMYEKTITLLQKNNKDILEMEEKLFAGKGLSKDLLEKMMIKKRNINFLKYIFIPQAEILEEAKNILVEFFDNDPESQEEIEVHFEDLEYKLDKVQNQIKILASHIDSLTEVYNSLMNIQINTIITILTIFTAIVGIHTLIAGWYGMNVPLPGQNNPFAFWFILASTIIITLGMIILFRIKKWI